jgi:hypothetical protein
MNRELFEDGSSRLSDADGTFMFRRPRPGVLVVTGTGSDRGQFDELPFAEIEAEGARFGPLELFIDTSGLEFVERAVVNRWTTWLQHLPNSVGSLGIVHGGEMTGLNVAVAAHLARQSGRLRTYPDRGRFEQAIRQADSGFAGLDTPPPAVLRPARRTETAAGVVALEATSARLEIQPLFAGRVLVTIEGYDRGEFGGTPFDEIQRCVGTEREWRLFLDLRAARGATGPVAAAWTRWFASHRHVLQAVDILAESQTVHVAVSYAHHSSGTHHVARVHRDPESFRAALAREPDRTR